jgi:hypothetical protein
MADIAFSWTRFWCPRDAAFLLASDGFLLDPESSYGTAANPDVVPFGRIETTPCLALLGEPGLGKSTALRQHQAHIKASGAGTDALVLWKDLNAYQSEERLIRAVFEDSRLTAWASGDGMLHLLLDSLDECLLRIDTLASLLSEQLAQLPISRLRLRLACRTAVWPALLEHRLRELWGDAAVGVYELAPLRRRDVAEATQASQVDAHAFLAEVDRREASPLASRPVTLRFLLRGFQRGEGWPSTQVDLYSRGCEQLCAEGSESRRAARRTGQFSPRQRMAVAGRIAAVSLFCARPVLWTGGAAGDVPEGDLALEDLLGGTEDVDGSPVEVSEAAVREVLDTGLFSARGLERIGFSHQTYAELLAADYLVRRGLAPSQILGLILHPGGGGEVVPQLQEAAAWLATLVPAVRDHILRTDPQVLLGSDVSTMSVPTREALVGSLLQLFDAGVLIDDDWDKRARYRKLAHPRLAEQLRPYIVDQAKNVIVRRVAIDIAEACQVQELQHLLTDVALDRTDKEHVREQAAVAVMKMGDRDTRLRLKPLLTPDTSDDPQDELKGAALLALWREDLLVEELLPALTPPKAPSFCGLYARFIRDALIGRLRPEDLPALLQWAADQPVSHDHEWPQPLVDSLLEMAWSRIADIHIDALTAGARPNAYDRISVIIEVKGCWNRKVNEDMEGQLRDRYLRDNRCQHGIYLVGWFMCSQWDRKGDRRWRTPKRTVAQAQSHFDVQARALSGSVQLRAVVLNAALR